MVRPGDRVLDACCGTGDLAVAASKVGGDVVYTVVAELDEQPADLRWGMSVKVEIATE